jgi:hypothetical protein
MFPIISKDEKRAIRDALRNRKIDLAVADHLMMLADGSNYGTLEELQNALRNWATDLHNDAQSIQEFAEC